MICNKKKRIRGCGLVLAAFIAAALGGCASAPPCSREALAKDVSMCIVRVKAECVEGDRKCPAYQECQAKVEAWRVCK